MTKEEQRFHAAVAAMNGFLHNQTYIDSVTEWNKNQSDFLEDIVSDSIELADALLEELDNEQSHIKPIKTQDVIVANTKVVRIDKKEDYLSISRYKDCKDRQCPIEPHHGFCYRCGSKIEWV